MGNLALQTSAPALCPTHTGLTDIDTLGEMVSKGRFLDAIEPLFAHLKSNPTDAHLLNLTAICTWYLNQHEAALTLVRTLLKHHPKSVVAWTKLGEMLVYLGKNAEAEDALRQALALDRNNIAAFLALSNIVALESGDRHLKTMRSQLKSKKLTNKQKSKLAYGIGRCERKLGQHHRAFHFFTLAKKYNSGRYDTGDTDRLLAGERRYLTPDVMAPREGRGDLTDAPVFIVGMPRSGTTLLEKMLLQHPDVASIGESRALSAIYHTLKATHARRTGQKDSWAWTAQVSDDEITACARGYLQNAHAALAGNPARIIDKMPLNCMMMGLAHLMFPNARYIFMRRHPLDVGLSNFTTLFQEGHAFANRLDWLGHRMHGVYASLDYSRSYLGPRLREQSYRALVEDTEGQARQILDFLDLDWSADVMQPERTEGAVMTASVTQIRKGINRKGLDKWRAYENELAPLLDALGGPDWLDDWQKTTDAIVAAQYAGA